MLNKYETTVKSIRLIHCKKYDIQHAVLLQIKKSADCIADVSVEWKTHPKNQL
jgi:hypothetical protein